MTDREDRDRLLDDSSAAGAPAEQREEEERGDGVTGGAIGGAAAGAIAGTIIGGPVGTAIGAAVGAVGGAALGLAEDASTIDDATTEAPATPPAKGSGGGTIPFSTGAAMTAGPGAAGVGGLGLPTASSEAETERAGTTPGPYDHPASYDETAAEVAKERPILVGDDPGQEAAETERAVTESDDRKKPPTWDYIRDRDDLAQGGEPR